MNTDIPFRDDPIIVTGVGHSGTRGFIEMAKATNVYLGDVANSKREWEFYRKLATSVCAVLYHLPDPHHASALTGKRLHNANRYRQNFQRALTFAREQIRERPDVSMPPANGPWIFKTPRTGVALDVWYELFPRARILQLVRDGRDVAFSLPPNGIAFKLGNRVARVRTPFLPQVPRLMRRARLLYGYLYWEEHLRILESFRREGIPVMDFRYEDLGDRSKLQNLCCRLGLEFSPAMLDRFQCSRGKGIAAMQGMQYDTTWLHRYGYEV